MSAADDFELLFWAIDTYVPANIVMAREPLSRIEARLGELESKHESVTRELESGRKLIDKLRVALVFHDAAYPPEG